MYSMSRVAGRIYVEDIARVTNKVTVAQPASPPRVVQPQYDWQGMRQRAYELGELPIPPNVDKQRRRILHDIGVFAANGNKQALLNLPIRGKNTQYRMLERYRDICVIALTTREAR